MSILRALEKLADVSTKSLSYIEILAGIVTQVAVAAEGVPVAADEEGNLLEMEPVSNADHLSDLEGRVVALEKLVKKLAKKSS